MFPLLQVPSTGLVSVHHVQLPVHVPWAEDPGLLGSPQQCSPGSQDGQRSHLRVLVRGVPSALPAGQPRGLPPCVLFSRPSPCECARTVPPAAVLPPSLFAPHPWVAISRRWGGRALPAGGPPPRGVGALALRGAPRWVSPLRFELVIVWRIHMDAEGKVLPKLDLLAKVPQRGRPSGGSVLLMCPRPAYSCWVHVGRLGWESHCTFYSTVWTF